jgi:hypothetical protein
LGALRALRTFGAVDSLRSLRTLSRLVLLGRCSLRAYVSLRSLRAFRAPRREHGEVCGIPDHVNDEVRDGERSEGKIAQAFFTSRCSISG